MASPPTAWYTWAQGVLQGVGAPATPTNLNSLWSWSVFESGPNVMRWNNPLNTTQVWAGASDMNSVGVKQYATVQDGVNATVVTLQNGRYNNIIRNLQQSQPTSAWWNAATDLNTWGSGTNWLPGAGTTQPGIPSLPNASTTQVSTANQAPTCVTSWSIGPLTNICMDGVIGGFAVAAGGALLLVGGLVLVVFGMKGTSVGRGASRTLTAMSGPVGLVKSAQSSFKQRAVSAQRTQATQRSDTQQATQQQHKEATQRATLRQQRAKARILEARARGPVSAEDKERAAERRIAASGKRPEPGTVKRGLT